MPRLGPCRRSSRAEKFEAIKWWEFIDADAPAHSEIYRKVVGKMPRALVAADPKTGSTRTLGDIFLQMVFSLGGVGNPLDRVLNGPTSEAWLEPWRAYLEKMGVLFHQPASVTAFKCAGGRITGVVVGKQGNVTETVTADYYVAALPVEAMGGVVNIKPLLGRFPPRGVAYAARRPYRFA